ncbi:MAG TPA: T9SS type A sorting domain-containing protein [bacterium]|nr:T9SS type A sorting domain-containing protein [bacterium]HPN42535.1 T9SS type A sorting domain-containing protein [bacterium]
MKRLFVMLMSILTVLFLMEISMARSFRVDQIPNGSKFGCTNCHTGYGGPRNTFGTQIFNNYMDAKNSSGNVLWGPALAAENADLDAATNGQELQDPDGAWRIGDPAPGELSLVSNPGNPASTTAIYETTGTLPQTIILQQNYPNPFNPETTIRFFSPQPGHVLLQIFNTGGQLVSTLVNGYIPTGEHQVIWTGQDENGNTPVSGIYLYRLTGNGFTETRQMLYLK